MSNFERRLDARLVVSVAAVGIMAFAGVVVETALNIAFPALMKEFGVTTAVVQWVTTAYLLVLSAIMPISSFLNRRFRNKTLFLAAMAVFVAGTAVCAAAPHFILLVVGRILQGIGAGIALPLMFNIVLQQAPVGKLGVMMGFATLIIAIAPAVGPSFGGFLVEAFGWRSIFLVLLPFLGLSLVLGALTVRQARDVEKVGFSPVQFLLVAASFTALVVAANAASEGAWTSPKTLGLLALAFALLAGFTWISRRSGAPLLRVRIFADRTYALSQPRLCRADPSHGAGLGLPHPVFRAGRQIDGLLRRRVPAAARMRHRSDPHPVRRKASRQVRGEAADPCGRRSRRGDFGLLCSVRGGRLGRSFGLHLHLLPDLPGTVPVEFDDARLAFAARGTPSGRQRGLQHRPAARRRRRHGCGCCDRQLGAGSQLWRRGGRNDGGRPDGVLRSARGRRRGIRRRPRRFSTPAARAGGEALAKRPD